MTRHLILGRGAGEVSFGQPEGLPVCNGVSYRGRIPAWSDLGQPDFQTYLDIDRLSLESKL